VPHRTLPSDSEPSIADCRDSRATLCPETYNPSGGLNVAAGKDSITAQCYPGGRFVTGRRANASGDRVKPRATTTPDTRAIGHESPVANKPPPATAPPSRPAVSTRKRFSCT